MERSFEAARRYVQSALTPDGVGIYADRGLEAGRRGINMVAAGLLSALYLGSLPTQRRLRRAGERLLQEPPEWDATAKWEATYQSYYYWYTASLALFHLGGEKWTAWNFFLKRALLPLENRKPHAEGSWPPESSWIGVSGGRVYSTAMAILTLETYYRYVPLASTRKG